MTDILSGAKSDTIRKASKRLPGIGEVVTLCVGPRPAFAHALIVKIEPIDPRKLPKWRRDQVLGCYAGMSGTFCRLSFRLVTPASAVKHARQASG